MLESVKRSRIVGLSPSIIRKREEGESLQLRQAGRGRALGGFGRSSGLGDDLERTCGFWSIVIIGSC